MKHWRKFSKSTSVYFPKKIDDYLFFSKKNMKFIKKKRNLINFKSRICSHLSNKDKIHEMLIFHKKGAYVRPHKHLNKLESFHLISGKVRIIFFNNNGIPIKVVKMGEYSSGKIFYYKLLKSCFHTVLIDRDVLFHEVTSGPYNKKQTIFAKWSPAQNDKRAVKQYLSKLKKINKL